MQCACHYDKDGHALLGPCPRYAWRVCPLCEQPICRECFDLHHDCKDEPQHIDMPQRRVEEVPA